MAGSISDRRDHVRIEMIEGVVRDGDLHRGLVMGFVVTNLEAKGFEETAQMFSRGMQRVLDALVENPRPKGAVRLQGTDWLRVRVGDYRVVYDVHDDVLLVLVIRIGHRR